MPFGIPTIETLGRENKMDVVTNILSIQMLRVEDEYNLLTGRGDIFGRAILNSLPMNVRSFTYSETLPTVTATRDIGTEDWDANEAFEWGISAQNEGVREGLLKRVGEIL